MGLTGASGLRPREIEAIDEERARIMAPGIMEFHDNPDYYIQQARQLRLDLESSDPAVKAAAENQLQQMYPDPEVDVPFWRLNGPSHDERYVDENGFVRKNEDGSLLHLSDYKDTNSVLPFVETGSRAEQFFNLNPGINDEIAALAPNQRDEAIEARFQRWLPTAPPLEAAPAAPAVQQQTTAQPAPAPDNF